MPKKLWLLCLLVLCACTYLPEPVVPTPIPCPTLAPCTVINVLPTAPPATEIVPTPTAVQPTPTETTTPVENTDAALEMPYVAEQGTPRLEEDFTHPGQGCAWVGVAGQVLDAVGEAETNQVVLVTGAMTDQAFDQVSLSGSAPVFGPAGFAIPLAQGVLSNQWYIQLFDLQGKSLSDPVLFYAPKDCEHTLVMVNFRHRP